MTNQKHENQKYLKEQLITYLGNKRSLLKEIDAQIIKIKNKLGKDKTINLDLFSGSGSVARLMKQHSSYLYVNDIEEYSFVLNSCYLANNEEFDKSSWERERERVESSLSNKPVCGIITENYSPKKDTAIKKGERVFYTNQNAQIIDTVRKSIDKISPKKNRRFFLAPLLVEASIKVNTCGVFKGFYKDKKTGKGHFGGTGEYSLSRIKSKIEIKEPILSNFSCKYKIYKEDAFRLVTGDLKNKKIDIAYLDPPYNQHPYGSNYFMLNIICDNILPNKISKISGIPKKWNKSNFNIKKNAAKELEKIIKAINSKFIILSYNSEGHIPIKKIRSILCKHGSIEQIDIPYKTFRGSRNLSERNLYVKEYLFILDKRK